MTAPVTASAHITASDGVAIAYECIGPALSPEGPPPVVLIHGFGANRKITWANTNWYQTLTRAGHSLIAVDCRGHGESGKPHAPESYDEARMAGDILAVLAGLDIAAADVMGYSMGAQLAIRLLHDASGRVRRAVLGGMGEAYFKRSHERDEAIASGLLAENSAQITNPVARDYRQFCERAGDDLVAMAACMRRHRVIFSPQGLGALEHKVLVVCGADDIVSGPPEPLARAFIHGAALTIPKRNHHSTVGDSAYKQAVTAFLAGPL